MDHSNRIRVLVLGLIQHDDRLFVAEGYDSVKQTQFYRALGGGIEFGETGVDALKREFQEEIQAELANIHYLGCLENLFVYNGNPGHELIQLYRCDFADPRFYQLEQLTFLEDIGNTPITGLWVACDRFRSSELQLVPPACLNYLA